MAELSSACVATLPPTMRRQVSKPGDGFAYPVIRASPTKMRRWKRRRRLGILPENTGSMAEAVRRGITMAYDPELNLVYIGTGNGAPWNRKLRSPSGGDNLYLASIVALNPDTGQYVWHYQETPGDNWDYTSTQPMILATIPVDGRPRKVILHAPKNGFFFVIDRTNGKFLSAKNYVDVNWATGYDANGRPIEVPEARGDKSFDAIPDPHGASNWHPMSYNPITGYAYIPAQHVPMKSDGAERVDTQRQHSWQSNEWIGLEPRYDINVTPPKAKPFGRLIAWDPVKQEQVWKQDYASPWNGGTLTTAGNLVFQGTADGRFVAYNAKTGEKLWESSTGTGVVAGPATYEVDGTQYVSVAVGWGGVYGESARATDKEAPGTVFTFAIGGKAPLPEFKKYQSAGLVQGVSTIQRMSVLVRYCMSATARSVMAFQASTKVGISRILATSRPRKSPISRTWCSRGRSRIRACRTLRANCPRTMS